MSGYTGLHSSIIHSTVWREADHVRILWVTLLAMCDRYGVVESSVPGLADAARITLEQCQEGLTILSGPDPWSRTKDYEGRRIKEVDGGWLVLNRTKYRDQHSAEHGREMAAERKRRQRERESSPGVTDDVTPCHAESRSVTPCHASSRSVTVGHGESRHVTQQSKAEQSRDKDKEEREARKRAPSRRRAPRRLMPEGWRPASRERDWAHDHGLDLYTEETAFRAWTEAGGYMYVDWDAAFRSHLVKARQRLDDQAQRNQQRLSLAQHEAAKPKPIPSLADLAEARKDQPKPDMGPAVPPPDEVRALLRGIGRSVPG